MYVIVDDLNKIYVKIVKLDEILSSIIGVETYKFTSMNGVIDYENKLNREGYRNVTLGELLALQ